MDKGLFQGVVGTYWDIGAEEGGAPDISGGPGCYVVAKTSPQVVSGFHQLLQNMWFDELAVLL